MPPTDPRQSELVTREELVGQLSNRLTRHGSPRLQLLFIISVAGAVAFLVSAGALRLGLSSMTVRYPLAAVCGYLTFIVLIRAWIAWQRGRGADVDIEPEMLDVDLQPGAPSDSVPLFQGGRSGGAGASGDWSAESSQGASKEALGGTHIDVDLDEFWPIAIAAACAAGALIAIVYVVYTAPLLLAEVALDGAVVTTLYRRMRRADAAHWAAATLRRTWLPAVVIVASATIAGFAFERIAPDARSIGGVIRELISATR